jgi:hypothetical protein
VGKVRGRTRDRIEGANGGHVGQGEDNLISKRDAASNETGVSALGDDGDAPVIAPFEDLADLLCCLWLKDGCRVTLVSTDPVVVIVLQLLGCC